MFLNVSSLLLINTIIYNFQNSQKNVKNSSFPLAITSIERVRFSVFLKYVAVILSKYVETYGPIFICKKLMCSRIQKWKCSLIKVSSTWKINKIIFKFDLQIAWTKNSYMATYFFVRTYFLLHHSIIFIGLKLTLQ